MNKLKLIVLKVIFTVISLGYSTSLFAQDTDSDGILNATDNCISIANPNQEDSDALVLSQNVAPLGTVYAENNYSSDFPASRAINGVIGYTGSYWLGPQTSNAGYFEFQLDKVRSIGVINMLNSRNASYNDRGTKRVRVFFKKLV